MIQQFMKTYLLDLFQKKESFDIEKAKELKPLFENEYTGPYKMVILI